MGFLDKKEDVIDLELTQYGKYLLSQGRFRPSLYAFFDDDILYDGGYGGVTESQEAIESRIKDSTPYNGVQYVYSGIETEIVQVNEIIRAKQKDHGESPVYTLSQTNIFSEAETGKEKILPLPEESYSTYSPIGTSDLSSNKYPSWSIHALAGNLTGSVTFTTGSKSSQTIPQLSASIIYEVEYRDEPCPEAAEDMGVFFKEQRIVFGDGSFITTMEKPLLIQIEEDHTHCTNENFDIEVFMLEETKTFSQGVETITSQKPVQLYWPGSIEENDANLSGYSYSPVTGMPETDLLPAHVNYFLNFSIDGEIDEQVMCNVKQIEDPTCLFPTVSEFECAIESETTIKDTYKQIDDEIEECD
tara:strand:- start:347 stop:1423 length:1077 start_codon:yes stop_codon:yes gene_type:complete